MKDIAYLITGSSTEMPCWYYEKKDLKTPPSVQDGLSFDAERRYRREGARFIMQCGTSMSLGHNTIATGVVYFHRFYMFHTFKNFPRYVTACCCLFLAGKVEETPKKCRDIIKTAKGLLTDDQFTPFGEDPKEEVMTLERILLQTIKFDLQVEHPYSFLVKYAKCLKGDQSKLQKMVQMAWNFVNDSLSTTVCLQWEPEIIAVALIHLASKLSKFTVVDWIGRQPHHLRWWDMFVADVTMEILEDVCHQVLDLYQANQANHNESESPPPHQTPSSSNTASPSNSKRSATPPQVPKPTSIATIVGSGKLISEEKLESAVIGNLIPKVIPPPMTESIHYMYQTNYPPMYTHGPPHYPPSIPGPPIAPAAPPPIPPPMYGGQYSQAGHLPPPPPHYGGGPPQMMSGGHRPPPQPPIQQNHNVPSSGYYQPPQYGRQRYPPPS